MARSQFLLAFLLLGCDPGSAALSPPPPEGGAIDPEGGTNGDADPNADGSLSMDASDENDASSGDGSGDGANEADAPMPMSQFCGDGIRDPITEECDDGIVSMLTDSCSSQCEVRDLLAYRTPIDAGAPDRSLSWGRHPVAANDTGLAAAWLEPATQAVRVTYYNAKGVPSGFVDTPSITSPSVDWSGPVIAPLPNGKFAIAYTAYSDGDGTGIGLRYLDPGVLSSGMPKYANTTKSFGQFDPDILWTGSEIVAAWVDTSGTTSDIRYRTFDGQLVPTSNELTLANANINEGDVALAPFNSGWAAAWREPTQNAQQIIRIKSGNTVWTTTEFYPAPTHTLPSMVELDSTHLLLFYATGKLDMNNQNSLTSLQAAVLDTSTPGQTSGSTVPPGLEARRPNAARVGSRIFVAYELASNVLLREVGWNGMALDWSKSAIAMPRWSSHVSSWQYKPALAPTSLFPQGALFAAWEDQGQTFMGSTKTDMAVELIPVPLVRFQNADGGGQ